MENEIMKKAQIRKLVGKNSGHVAFRAYESHDRCHLELGLDEPDCIASAPLKFVADREIIGYQTEVEAVRACLEECVLQSCEVDLDMPAFEYDLWDGSLKRLPELDRRLVVEEWRSTLSGKRGALKRLK